MARSKIWPRVRGENASLVSISGYMYDGAAKLVYYLSIKLDPALRLPRESTCSCIHDAHE